jgi:hypothetical protein
MLRDLFPTDNPAPCNIVVGATQGWSVTRNNLWTLAQLHRPARCENPSSHWSGSNLSTQKVKLGLATALMLESGQRLTLRSRELTVESCRANPGPQSDVLLFMQRKGKLDRRSSTFSPGLCVPSSIMWSVGVPWFVRAGLFSDDVGICGLLIRR